MPTIMIPDATYQRLSRHAARLGTTVEAVAVPALEQVGEEPKGVPVPPPAPPVDLPFDEWKKLMDSMVGDARKRADRYPPGHFVDVSRESIYQGCGE